MQQNDIIEWYYSLLEPNGAIYKAIEYSLFKDGKLRYETPLNSVDWQLYFMENSEKIESFICVEATKLKEKQQQGYFVELAKAMEKEGKKCNVASCRISLPNIMSAYTTIIELFKNGGVFDDWFGYMTSRRRGTPQETEYFAYIILEFAGVAYAIMRRNGIDWRYQINKGEFIVQSDTYIIVFADRYDQSRQEIEEWGTMPQKLAGNKEAQRIIKDSVKYGLLLQAGEKYRWNNTRRLFAYWCKMFNNKLWSSQRIKWGVFCELTGRNPHNLSAEIAKIDDDYFEKNGLIGKDIVDKIMNTK